MDGRTDGRTDGISPHSTGLCPLSGPLPKKKKKKKKKEKEKEKEKEKKNQSPKGIMRSAVPLPCFFDIVKSQEGSRAAAPTGDKVL